MAGTIKINTGNTRMIAHQGLHALERGNTNQAFIAAGNREKYYGIETDVQRTGDGKYVIIHDETTGNISRTNLRVAGSTLEELRAITLLDNEGKPGRADLRLPTLQEYFKICKFYEKKSILEIKVPMQKESLAEIVNIAKEMGQLDDTVFISFHRRVLIDLRELLPDHPMQYLTTAWNEDVREYVLKYNLGVDIAWTVLSETAFREMKALGLEVNSWNVDDPALGEKLASWGIDYLTTGILE